MRYIDADKLIDKIFPIGLIDDGNYTINAKAVKIAIDKMPTAEVVPKSEWISVDERLPDLCDRDPDWSVTVLFRTTQGHLHSGYRYVGRAQTSFYDDSWSPPYWLDESENLSFEVDEVTHWMPLPEAPKMKGGE